MEVLDVRPSRDCLRRTGCEVAFLVLVIEVLNVGISVFRSKPFSWGWGQYKPTVNEYSWTNLSSVLYIEQPVGTGFSQGTPNIENEDDLAAQFVGFLQQFLEVFPELKGKKTYLAGESVSFIFSPGCRRGC